MNGKILVTLEYNGLISNIEFEQFKSIFHIREKANTLFYTNKDTNLKILYNGKDLKDHENQKICEFFVNKPKVKFKVVKDEMSAKELAFVHKQNSAKNSGNYPLFDYQTLGISYARSSSLKKYTKENLTDSLKIKDNDILTNEKYKCKCLKDRIAFLCRNCNQFICQYCKIDVSSIIIPI